MFGFVGPQLPTPPPGPCFPSSCHSSRVTRVGTAVRGSGAAAAARRPSLIRRPLEWQVTSLHVPSEVVPFSTLKAHVSPSVAVP